MLQVCDFCGETPIAWEYPTHSPTTHWHDPWMACQTCHTLIEGDDWERLLVRTLQHRQCRSNAYTFDHDPDKRKPKTADPDVVWAIQDLFRQSRSGEAIKLTVP